MKTIRAAGAALLVIDVQAGLFGTNPPPHQAEAVVNNINSLTARARAAQVPVVFVQHEGRDLPRASGKWQLHSGLQVEEKDWRVSKNTCDAFFGSGLAERLHSVRVNTLVMAGYATDFCVDTTVRNAVSREFEVIIAADAHTTTPGGGLTAAQIIAHHNYAWAECVTCRPVSVVRAGEIEFVNR